MNSSNCSSNRSNNCRLDGNKAEEYKTHEALEARKAYKEQSNAQFSPCSQPKASGTPIVSLSDIIMALEMTNDESCAYLDTETGEIKWQFDFDPSLSDISTDISSEELEADESKRYIPLPDTYEINEYHMIEAFAYDHDDHSGGRLERAIQGRGAFRRFRETVARLGLLDEWYEFRDNCYRERAVSWCRGHNISFVEYSGNEHDSSKHRGNRNGNRNGKRDGNRNGKRQKVQQERQGG